MDGTVKITLSGEGNVFNAAGELGRSVNVYASEGGHSPKTWARIITNRIIQTAPDASPELKQKYQDEKHRIEALIASYIPTIKDEVK